jgi:hypothetical protein
MASYKSAASPARTEYVELLSFTVCAWMAVTVLLGLAASYNYAKDATIIENITNRDISEWWTIGLLWIPLLLQLTVLFFLLKQVRRQKHDETIRHYLKFYFKRTFMASCAYTALWWSYTQWVNGNADARTVYGFRWLSLLAITLLIYFVVQVTYLITKSSPRDEKRLFTENDIDELELASISEKLRAVSQNRPPGTEDHTNGDSVLKKASPEEVASAALHKIYSWLLRSRDYKVHRVTYKGTLDDLDKPHLVEALNRLVCSRDFYRDCCGGAGNQEDAALYQRERRNREYLEGYLLNSDKPNNGSENETPEAIKSIKTQKRIDEEIGQRDGIRMFPFYTLIFFFSIFLCTAYIFGFAFAFEDKHVQLLDAKQHGALFMTDEFLEDNQQTDPSLIRASDIKDSGRFVGKVFGSGHALSDYFRSRLTPRTAALLQSYDKLEKPAAPSGQLLNALIYELNGMLKQPLFEIRRFDNVRLREATIGLLRQTPQEKQLTHLNRLLLEDMYPDDLVRMSEDYKLHALREKFFFGSGGAGVQVAVLDTAKRAEKYIAQINYASLGAVVNEVRNALEQNKLVRLEIVGRADDNANRGNSYTSNDGVSAARVRTIRYAIQEQLIGMNLSAHRMADIEWVEMPLSNDSTLLPKRRKPQRSIASEAENNAFVVLNDGSAPSTPSNLRDMQKLIDDFKNDNIRETKEASSTDQVVEWWKRFREAAKRVPPSEGTITSFYQDIKSWISATAETNRDNPNGLKEKLSRELYQLEDLEGSKRAVEVFIFESSFPRADPEQNPSSKRMALMDYVYFAMYTITTTGYGDIKPITPYTKFLCTLANMTEFFFIVVFFNTLLSLRRRKGDIA